MQLSKTVLAALLAVCLNASQSPLASVVADDNDIQQSVQQSVHSFNFNSSPASSPQTQTQFSYVPDMQQQQQQFNFSPSQGASPYKQPQQFTFSPQQQQGCPRFKSEVARGENYSHVLDAEEDLDGNDKRYSGQQARGAPRTLHEAVNGKKGQSLGSRPRNQPILLSQLTQGSGSVSGYASGYDRSRQPTSSSRSHSTYSSSRRRSPSPTASDSYERIYQQSRRDERYSRDADYDLDKQRFRELTKERRHQSKRSGRKETNDDDYAAYLNQRPQPRHERRTDVDRAPEGRRRLTHEERRIQELAREQEELKKELEYLERKKQSYVKPNERPASNIQGRYRHQAQQPQQAFQEQKEYPFGEGEAAQKEVFEGYPEYDVDQEPVRSESFGVAQPNVAVPSFPTYLKARLLTNVDGSQSVVYDDNVSINEIARDFKKIFSAASKRSSRSRRHRSDSTETIDTEEYRKRRDGSRGSTSSYSGSYSSRGSYSGSRSGSSSSRSGSNSGSSSGYTY